MAVVAYGGTMSDWAWAIAAGRRGTTATIVSPNANLYTMWGTGLTRTDTSFGAEWGIIDELVARMGAYAGISNTKYGTTANLIATADAMLAEVSAFVTVVKNKPLEAVNKLAVAGGMAIVSIVCGGTTYAGTNFFDGTDEGDLAAMAGCLMRTGRESESVTGEPDSGNTPWETVNFATGFYPATGQRYDGVSAMPVQQPGDSDWRFMAFNMRVGVTQHASRINWADLDLTPVGGDLPAETYRVDLEICVSRNILTIPGTPGGSAVAPPYGLLPVVGGVQEFDMNNGGGLPVGTNQIGGNNDWMDMTWAERDVRIKQYVQRKFGLFKTICTDGEWLARRPALVADTKTWGLVASLAAGPFAGAAIPGASPAMYIRCGRRIVGQDEQKLLEMVIPHNNTIAEPVTSYGYFRDVHNTQIFCSSYGRITLEGGNGPFLPPVEEPVLMKFGSLKARKNDAINLMVGRAISGSYQAWVPVRIEMGYIPVAEVCGVAASLADAAGTYTGVLPYSTLRPELVELGSPMTV